MNNTENINYPKPKREYKVLVRCFTYNHSKYIEDALNGFAIQQTNFPYVCFVMDDASTDGEQEVIKNWMERECDMRRAETFDIPTSVVIIVPHKNNQSCTFAFYLLKQNLNGTGERKMKHVYPWREKCMYEALCEGDDYWINPLKLEMQYNALEADSQATMVYCNFDTIDSNGNKLYRSEYEKLKKYYRSGDNLSRLFKRNYPLTCTIMIKLNIYKTSLYIDSPSKIDYSIFMCAAFYGKLIYIDEIVSLYRLNPNSMMNSNINLVLNEFRKANIYFSKEYSLGHCNKRNFISDFCIKYTITDTYLLYKIKGKYLFKNFCDIDNYYYLFMIIITIVKVIRTILRVK